MKRTPFPAIVIIAVLLAALSAVLFAVLGGMALAAQDRFTVKVPNGIAFADFRRYENWQNVAVSQTENGLKVIAANAAMINAYRQDTPGNGKKFPEGSKIVKIEWSSKKSAESPYSVMVPDILKSVSFIEKDTKRFRTREDGDMPSFIMMVRPTRFSRSGTCRMRACVPHGCSGKGLHFHGIS
jgi:hypothetical protein